MRVLLAVPLAVALAVGGVVAAAGQQPERAVIETVQAFFDAMAAKDGATLQALLVSDGRVTSFRDDSGVPRISEQGAMAASIADAEARFLERMWDPTVLVHGPIAQLWAPYDFWVDGEFSHCGVDSFTLVRAEGRWRIANMTYTVEREGCAPSPLGPPAEMRQP